MTLVLKAKRLDSENLFMSDDVLVRVEGVSKKFCRSLKKSLWYGMQDLGNEVSKWRGRA
jgi:lipopolysaccharide transport system ATP-binding protein